MKEIKVIPLNLGYITKSTINQAAYHGWTTGENISRNIIE
jgi:hypothetical protein